MNYSHLIVKYFKSDDENLKITAMPNFNKIMTASLALKMCLIYRKLVLVLK